MNINKIQINGYGKLKDTKIELEKGINIIYGENEVGKSTLLNYITSSFYGISKNKKGKEVSDFEKYTPWNLEEFSGKLEYELDNNEKYEIFRDFKKKNPKIFNENKEDISKNFNIDKTKGNEFFYEQTKVDEDLFKATFLMNQQETKLNNSDQHMLIQKISNLVGAGEDNVSYKIAMDRLNRKQLEEVGTQRSREKPINVITREINELEKEKEELKKYENLKYEIEDSKNRILEEIQELENKNNIIKEIKKINNKKIFENEKIKIQEKIEKENNEKINNLNNEKIEIEKKEKNIIEKNNKIRNQIKMQNMKFLICFVVLIVLNVIQFIFIKNRVINYLFILTVPLFLSIYALFIKRTKNKRKNDAFDEIKHQKSNIESQIKVINENNQKTKNEINKLKEKINLENNLEKEKITKKYKKIEINNLNNEKNIDNEIEKIQSLINKNKLKIHTLDLDKENIEPKLDNLSKLEEDLEKDKQLYFNIKQKEKSIELAKEVLTCAYQKMKDEVTPKFTKQLSENIGNITKGRYSKALYNESEGLVVELNNGDYVNANKLSLGTIDQLYLSLRLSMIDDLSKEKLPIIMDESFAFYDNKRLKNILIYFSEKLKNRQIIIFTCTNREKEILEKNNIKFNYIELN